MNEVNIELLAPAKNTETGIEAIKHGADAVYIGAPKFGARYSASNTIEDIDRLVKFAHGYGARIYVTVNTILYDEELPEAEKLIHDLYKIGVDALIVQDTSIFKLDLPPIAIHSSTQAENSTLEKVKFWESIGCEQVVLARELSIDQIKNIHQNTSVRLEAFVHGALCVSYSGKCYVSQALTGRSANRGECAQICRLLFDLQDREGHSLGKKHWLSLKDFNASDYVGEMIDAGVRSFKIEGRLKDITYVKNIVAYYRGKIDEALKSRPQFKKQSFGECTYTFTPNPYKSFNRGFTSFFLNGRQNYIFQPISPKSFGEPIGTVIKVDGKKIWLKTSHVLNNGDGFCFVNSRGELEGFRANTANGGLITSAESVKIAVGDKVYRNNDEAFNKTLGNESAKRKIKINISVIDKTFRFSFGEYAAEYVYDGELDKAQKDPTSYISTQLSKLGDSIFEAGKMNIDTCFFFPASILGNIRRTLCEELVLKISKSLPSPSILPSKNDTLFPLVSDSYLNNIANAKAMQFYYDHGAKVSARAFEVEPKDDATLMFCKHCIRFALGACPKQNKTAAQLNEPLFLIHKNYYLRLHFNCKDCVMEVRKG
ncbi:MAG: U32 family peptidase [Paludibacteraceae bacterium]|nr:U32 family peptidase [Paludibacteraceae bacterium]